ncbi:MAG: hypothetical protein NWF07_15730 [Candidatus Bathyarchaeota archaeon]|nr:hypothetical protein [Candidatus Bathyarchaeota archaeon]
MADRDVGPLAGATQNWTTLALMVVVGAIALASLYMGFTNYGEGNIETAFMYILIGVSGFVALGFTFFRAKPVSKTQDGPKEAEVVTTLECPQCNLKRVRAFQPGDYIFKKDEPCTRCEGMMTITKINARKDPKKKKD